MPRSASSKSEHNAVPPAGTYHIWTIGCQMNEADSRRLASQLEALGFVETRRAEDADVAVLNTCVVRQQPEEKAAAKLRALIGVKNARRPDMLLAVMGCMVGRREAEDLARHYPLVDLFLAPSQTDALISRLLERDGCGPRPLADGEEYRLPATDQGQAVCAYVPATLGCSHACSYCIIPYRRGPDRSRPPAEILDEVRALVAQGIKEVNLLGQIVDRYGFDLESGINLAWLLREVAQVEGLQRVRFLTSHPSYMDEELIRTVATTQKLCPCFELPFQAGSDRILESMRRGYTQQQYRDLIARIRAVMPDAAINTDVIVGYPGETEEDFLDTVRLVRDLRLDLHHIAKYSPRPHTVAARLKDDVPAEEKERRRAELDRLVAEINDEKNAALLGQTVEVLVESFQPKKNRWRGRTPHNRIVFFEHEGDCRGRIVPVRIEWTGPFSLIGRPDSGNLRP